jgi:hypothetical protein
MTNAELCREWVTDRNLAHAKTSTGSLYVSAGILYSYGSHYPLALRYMGEVYVNNTRYSQTTSSKHRSPLLYELAKAGVAYKDASTHDMKLMECNLREGAMR